MKYLPKFVVRVDATKFEEELQELAECGYKVTHHAVAMTMNEQGNLYELYTAIMEKED